MLEKYIERKIVAYAKLNGFQVKKLYNKADPDRLFITPIGQFFFIEFKQLGKIPTSLQLLHIQQLINMKCQVYVVDTVENGIKIIDHYINNSKIFQLINEECLSQIYNNDSNKIFN